MSILLYSLYRHIIITAIITIINIFIIIGKSPLWPCPWYMYCINFIKLTSEIFFFKFYKSNHLAHYDHDRMNIYLHYIIV